MSRVNSLRNLLQLVCLLPGLALGQTVRSSPTSASGPPTRWVLLYAGSKQVGLATSYKIQDLVQLTAALDTSGRPVGWLFTGAIALQLYAPSGHLFATWAPGTPADGTDWTQYLDSLFAPVGVFARLDSAVALVSNGVQPLMQPYQVAIMIPYPDPKEDTLKFQSQVFRLGSVEGRAGAVEAYVTQAVSRFRASHYSHLSLYGFYWLNESIHGSDEALVPEVAKSVHRTGLKLLWIPFYTAWGVDAWRRWGFDQAWLQPNYFFHLDVPQLRLDSAATRAKSLGMGIELEFNGRVYSSPAYYDRLGPYLSMLEVDTTLRARAVTVYEGGGALLHLARSKNERERVLYDRFVQALSATDSSAVR